MATYNLHAGHNPAGHIACGAVGILNESIEDRKVKDTVVNLMRFFGHTVYDCTVDNGFSQNDVLKKIVSKCNSHNVDLDVSIHFNSGRSDYNGDGVTGGCEVWIHPQANASTRATAQHVCNAIASMGYKNRGVKTSPTLYFLNSTKAQAILIECCFVDDRDDANLYNAELMAWAIVSGLSGQDTNAILNQPQKNNTSEEVAQTNQHGYQVKVTASTLNVRKNPTTSSAITTTVRKGQVYTIVEESNGWGKLKSGAGWISLAYTKKI